MHINEVSISGMVDLSSADREKVARYVMDKAHWTFKGVAEKVKKKTDEPAAQRPTLHSGGSDARRGGDSELGIVARKPEKQQFVIPSPGGKNAPSDFLAGKTIVVTGIFPEVGGGAGQDIGKDRVRQMITSFGGKVTTAVSGRTDILVVGKDPGFSKVLKARKNSKTRLLNLHDLRLALEQGTLEEGKKETLQIKNFARGYARRRGGPINLALQASVKDLAIASGSKPNKLHSRALKTQRSPSQRVAAGVSIVLKRPSASPKISPKRRRLK